MPLIGTHDGKFHADEALGIFLLQLLPEYKDSQIVRSRDPALLATCDLVLDVGGAYDAAAFKFDHHQRGFAETLSSRHRTKLSSAGLIYKHYGRAVIQQLYPQTGGLELETFYDKLYEELIEEFDAVDNGISAWPAAVEPAFKVGATTIFAHVERLNPEWNETHDDTVTKERFQAAVQATGRLFLEMLATVCQVWWPARQLVAHAYAQRPEPSILVLERSCPWKTHLLDLERENAEPGTVLYVLYPDALHGQWMIQAVPAHVASFTSRLPLPEPWRGLRGPGLDAILEKSDLPKDAIFVHASGFIGGHKTKEGALAMAKHSFSLAQQ